AAFPARPFAPSATCPPARWPPGCGTNAGRRPTEIGATQETVRMSCTVPARAAYRNRWRSNSPACGKSSKQDGWTDRIALLTRACSFAETDGNGASGYDSPSRSDGLARLPAAAQVGGRRYQAAASAARGRTGADDLRSAAESHAWRAGNVSD